MKLMMVFLESPTVVSRKARRDSRHRTSYVNHFLENGEKNLYKFHAVLKHCLFDKVSSLIRDFLKLLSRETKYTNCQGTALS